MSVDIGEMSVYVIDMSGYVGDMSVHVGRCVFSCLSCRHVPSLEGGGAVPAEAKRCHTGQAIPGSLPPTGENTGQPQPKPQPQPQKCVQERSSTLEVENQGLRVEAIRLREEQVPRHISFIGSCFVKSSEVFCAL